MKENTIQSDYKSDYKAFRTFTTGPPSKWISAKPKAKEESDSWKFDWDEKLDEWEERTAKGEDKPDKLEKRPMKGGKRNGKWKKKPDTWKDKWENKPKSEEKPGKWKGKGDKREKKSDAGKSVPKTGAGWIKKVSLCVYDHYDYHCYHFVGLLWVSKAKSTFLLF